MKDRLLLVCLLSNLFLHTQAVAFYPSDAVYVSPVSDTLAYETHFFEDTALLHITLRYDITAFMKTKAKQEERYFPAELVIYPDKSDSIVKSIRLKSRGNFRKQFCYFPPIHLNFKTDSMKGKDAEAITKIKLVTHCKSSKLYEQYVLKEYLAYRIYNLLTENSFKVRLVRISYEDTGKKQLHFTKYGFLIEPVKLLAQRQECLEVEVKGLKPYNYVREDLDRIAVFNYMIGNTDWRLSAGHNLKFFKSNDPFRRELNVVPHDFDYSGLVNTDYAIPQEWSVAETVVERDYLGFCWEVSEETLKTLTLFTATQAKIMDEIRRFNYLTKREQSIVEYYVEAFYNEIRDTKSFLRMIERSCEPID